MSRLLINHIDVVRSTGKQLPPQLPCCTPHPPLYHHSLRTPARPPGSTQDRPSHLTAASCISWVFSASRSYTRRSMVSRLLITNLFTTSSCPRRSSLPLACMFSMLLSC